MEKRKLGNLEVSSMGFGCMGLSHAYGTAMEKSQAITVLKEAYEMGYTLFDTAECYTGIFEDGSISYNEEIVGEALQRVRDKVVISSKFGVRTAKDKSLQLDSRSETIRSSVEESLKKLKTDHIDLYYQHRIDPKTTPEEVAATMKDLIKEGKILHWGISETTEEYLRRAHAVCPVTAVQNRYSMMARWHQSLFPVVEELNVGFVAFSPMANGFLTAKYDQNSRFDGDSDYRTFMPQYTEEGMKKGKDVLTLLETLAKEKNATPAQISLAWMLCQKPWIVPIPGSRKIARLEENKKAASIEISADEIDKINAALDKMDVLVFGGH